MAKWSKPRARAPKPKAVQRASPSRCVLVIVFVRPSRIRSALQVQLCRGVTHLNLPALWVACIIFMSMFMFMLIINIHTNIFMHWAWSKQTFKWFLCLRTEVCYAFFHPPFKFNVLCKELCIKANRKKITNAHMRAYICVCVCVCHRV